MLAQSFPLTGPNTHTGYLDHITRISRIHCHLNGGILRGVIVDAHVAVLTVGGSLGAVRSLVSRYSDGVDHRPAWRDGGGNPGRERDRYLRADDHRAKRADSSATPACVGDGAPPRRGINASGPLPYVQCVGQDDAGGILRPGAGEDNSVGERLIPIYKDRR